MDRANKGQRRTRRSGQCGLLLVMNRQGNGQLPARVRIVDQGRAEPFRQLDASGNGEQQIPRTHALRNPEPKLQPCVIRQSIVPEYDPCAL